VELCQVTHQGALPLDATRQDLHQQTSDRFVSQRLLSVILHYFFHLQSHRAFSQFSRKNSLLPDIGIPSPFEKIFRELTNCGPRASTAW
jgi:hypothetical protein